MTEQEQELLKNILLWEHEKAPELAMLLVKGIDLEDRNWKGSFRLAKQFLPQAIEDCTNKTKTTPIPSDIFLNTSWKGMVHHLGDSLNDLALFYILYCLYPDSYKEVETLEVFKPEGGRVRIQKLLKDCSINDRGKPQLSNWYDEYSIKKYTISFFVQLISECPEDLDVDDSLRRSNITKLDLSENQLSALPSTIGNLTSLTELYLNDNHLSALPSTIGNLTSLTRLNLNYNMLSALPSTIGNLTSLKELDLGGNQLNALPSTIVNLTSLTGLDLGGNQLSALPSTIGNLTSLTELYLYNNQLSELPSTIGNLTSLTVLHLRNNQLSELPSTIVNLTSLKELDLGGNQLNALPSTIVNLTSLTRLDLGGNQLSALPSTIVNLTSLTVLHLRNNQLSSEQKQQIQAQFPFAEV